MPQTFAAITLCVCLSAGHIGECAKMTELIKMLFGALIWVQEPFIRWKFRFPTGRGSFEDEACSPAAKLLNYALCGKSTKLGMQVHFYESHN